MEGFNLAGPLSFCDLERAQSRKVELPCWFLTYICSALPQKWLHLLSRLTFFLLSFFLFFCLFFLGRWFSLLKTLQINLKVIKIKQKSLFFPALWNGVSIVGCFFLKKKCIIKVAALFIREANEIITTVSEDTQDSTGLKHCLKNPS